MIVRRKLIRSLVRNALVENGIEKAPVDVLKIAMSERLEVRKEDAPEDISGYLFRSPGEEPAVIGVNKLQSTNRQRFTIAHEIGHYLLHSDGKVHVDRRYEIQRRDNKSKEGTDNDEKEANLFAAELLMPEEFLHRDLAELGGIDLADETELKKLAVRYQVSPQALAFRLAYLGYS